MILDRVNFEHFLYFKTKKNCQLIVLLSSREYHVDLPSSENKDILLFRTEAKKIVAWSVGNMSTVHIYQISQSSKLYRSLMETLNKKVYFISILHFTDSIFHFQCFIFLVDELKFCEYFPTNRFHSNDPFLNHFRRFTPL